MAQLPLQRMVPSIIGHAQVDDEDLALVAQHNWTISEGGYVVRGKRDGKRTTTVTLARVIMGLDVGDPRTVDHINRDKLDNHRANLRIIPHGGQSQNRGSRPNSTSRYRGVHFCQRNQKWVAKVAGKHLGYFSNEERAANVAEIYRIATMEYAVD